MRNLIKLNLTTDVLKLNFKGLEIVETKVGNGGTDFKGIEIRDTITGTSLRIEMGPYSDINIYIDKQPTFKDVFVATGKNDKVELKATFDSEKEAQDWINGQSEIGSFVITPTKVEVKD